MVQFLIARRSNRVFYFILTDHEGDLVSVSDNYTSRRACERAIKSAISCCDIKSHLKRYTTEDDRVYFTLKGENKRIVITSELYDDYILMERAIAAVTTCRWGSIIAVFP